MVSLFRANVCTSINFPQSWTSSPSRNCTVFIFALHFTPYTITPTYSEKSSARSQLFTLVLPPHKQSEHNAAMSLLLILCANTNRWRVGEWDENIFLCVELLFKLSNICFINQILFHILIPSCRIGFFSLLTRPTETLLLPAFSQCQWLDVWLFCLLLRKQWVREKELGIHQRANITLNIEWKSCCFSVFFFRGRERETGWFVLDSNS